MTENLNIEVEQEENADVEVESDIETGNVEEETDEIIEDIEIKQSDKQSDIKEILNNKKEISKKQSDHLKNARIRMAEKEKEKKILMKKFNELVKLDINLDDVIENAKQLKIKRDYENLFGKKKQEDEEILKKPKKQESMKKKFMKNHNQNKKIKFHQDLMLLEIN